MDEITRNYRETIEKAQAELIEEVTSGRGVLVDTPLQHNFADGMYARTIFVPAGTRVVTKLHKKEHITILLQGSALVASERGVERITGPCVFVTKSGTKRAIYTETDVTWTTVHSTHATDLDDIEDEVIAKSFEEYEQERPCLLQ